MPQKDKDVYTGQGAASKEQVAAMLMSILKFSLDILNSMPPMVLQQHSATSTRQQPGSG